MLAAVNNVSRVGPVIFETLSVRNEGSVLFAEISSPPMNLWAPKWSAIWSPHSVGRSR
jgi:hypothetical protein